MKKILIIKADTNDADYVHRINEVTDKEIEQLKPIIKVIKNIEAEHGHNWDNSEYGDTPPEELYKDKLTREQIDLFNGYTPHGEYGIHTIEEVKILEVIKETRLL